MKIKEVIKFNGQRYYLKRFEVEVENLLQTMSGEHPMGYIAHLTYESIALPKAELAVKERDESVDGAVLKCYAAIEKIRLHSKDS